MVLLLILTALGNAWATFLISLVLLIGVFFLFRQGIGRGGMLAATVGSAVAIIIALIMLLR